MLLIGVDYQPSFHTIASFMEETGEYGEQELNHSDGEAERFYCGFVPCVFEPQDACIERHHIKGRRLLTPTTRRSASRVSARNPSAFSFSENPAYST
jgi:hypothetical protein